MKWCPQAQRFRVPKGTLVKSRGGVEIRKTSREVWAVVDRWDHRPSEICWPGAGGYWCYALLEDVIALESGSFDVV